MLQAAHERDCAEVKDEYVRILFLFKHEDIQSFTYMNIDLKVDYNIISRRKPDQGTQILQKPR